VLEPASIQEIFTELKSSLTSDEAAKEAKIILETILNLSPEELLTHSETKLTRNQLKIIRELRDKRNSEKIPLAYLLEEAPFRNLLLFVNNDVLIPRPETELLIDIILDEIKQRKIYEPVILDLGTGSGCIAISLKLALPRARILASDISRTALNVASINAKRYNADIEWVMGDYFDPFTMQTSSPIAIPVMKGAPPYFDIIVSNPPYVSEEDYKKLEPELFHEPKHALTGFPYKTIKEEGAKLLKPGGFIVCEFGQGQETQLSKIFPEAKFHKDLSGITRHLVWSPEASKKILGFDPL
jgi:release factor glutamine methyltransferase